VLLCVHVCVHVFMHIKFVLELAYVDLRTTTDGKFTSGAVDVQTGTGQSVK
jgi:hypothetical protein